MTSSDPRLRGLFHRDHHPANDHPDPTTGVETIPALDAWFRRRTDIEDRIRDLPTTA